MFRAFRVATMLSLALLGALLRLAAQQASAAAPPAAHTTVRCNVRRAPVSAAETAFARGRYDEAISLFRQQAGGNDPEADRAHDGLIQSLLRARKFSEAEADATAWHNATPGNAWSIVALAEVQWRQGRSDDALKNLSAAAAIDPCNAQVHADFARMQILSGMLAGAKRNLDFAHNLDPGNPQISNAWVNLQPRAVQLANLTSYMTTRENLGAEEKASLEHEKERLAHTPAHRCELAGTIQSTAIPFSAIQDGLQAPLFWGLDVGFNGKSRRLEIDTGAHGLLLTRSAAAALHLVPVEQGKSFGIGDEGAVNSFLANVDSIRIGALEFHHCDVEVLGKNPATMQSKDGLIGGDVFASFLLTLDFPGRILKLDPLPPLPGERTSGVPTLATGVTAEDEAPRDRYVDPSMKDWARVFRSGHDLILPVRLNEGPTRLFIVDSGSSLNLISNEAAREVAKVSNGSGIQLYGISGEVKKLYTTGPLTLTFANLKQPSSGMTAMDTSRLGEEAGVEIAGFLGAPTLHQLTVQIDYRDNLMHFSYDPKRIQHCLGGIYTAFRSECY